MLVTAIDFETANSSPASVISVGLAVMEDGVIGPSFSSLIRPEPNVSTFSRWNYLVHGIRPSDVENAPSFPEVYRRMKPFLTDGIVVAHNAPFDMGCLKSSCLNTGIELPSVRYFDTVLLSRRLLPDLEHHRLNDVCDELDIPLNHHEALSDACGALMIVAKAMEMTGLYEIEELVSYFKIKLHMLR